VREALHLMEEKDRFNKMKIDQLRADIQAGIASGDAGTLDVEAIKRHGRARLGKPTKPR
jgi:antitoxin ParD1/3/4